MKVIVAGYSKTGTKSMASALRELGFTVYDFPEHFSEHKQQWKEILQSGNNPDIFWEMYKDVDAVVDAPAFAYWKEIHEVFPDAKIILTSCEESPWFEKWQRQFENAASNPVYRLLTLLSPTAYQFNIHGGRIAKTVYGVHKPWRPTGFRDYSLNKMMAIRIFRAHNADVIQNAPADKLLQFNVKQGWDPLCKFLEVPAPEKPFPHKNAGGTVLNDVIAENPTFQKMKKEMLVSSGLLAGALLVGGWRLWARFARRKRVKNEPSYMILWFSFPLVINWQKIDKS